MSWFLNPPAKPWTRTQLFLHLLVTTITVTIALWVTAMIGLSLWTTAIQHVVQSPTTHSVTIPLIPAPHPCILVLPSKIPNPNPKATGVERKWEQHIVTQCPGVSEVDVMSLDSDGVVLSIQPSGK